MVVYIKLFINKVLFFFVIDILWLLIYNLVNIGIKYLDF